MRRMVAEEGLDLKAAGPERGGEAAGRIGCRRAEEEDLVDRYVGGRLSDSDSEREVFEEHYFECARCASLVALATAVRRSIRGLDEDTPAARPSTEDRCPGWPPKLLTAGTGGLLRFP